MLNIVSEELSREQFFINANRRELLIVEHSICRTDLETYIYETVVQHSYTLLLISVFGSTKLELN